MPKQLYLTTFQIGTTAQPGQGLRIGVTRFPPRGVPKDRWAADGYFDVWLPVLAPSAKLVAEIRKKRNGPPDAFQKQLDRYERELLSNATGRQTVEFLAAVAARTPISIGCACADESRCHRSRLFKIIEEHAPKA
ncbi:MAG TPA: DUF488 family protein [Terracidiphilus sp.]|nr:DUF488 family protein [Terracidiphilus sp.]